MSNFKMPTAYHPSNAEWVRPIESLTSDGVRELQRLKAENAKLLWLVNDMRACFRIGAERDGVSKQWCYELFDSYTGKLRELGIEVGG